jgi:photosystem II PsbX protein
MGKKTLRIINVEVSKVKKGNNYMTPSLANFMWSLVWGTVIVVIPVTLALIVISQSDKIKRS